MLEEKGLMGKSLEFAVEIQETVNKSLSSIDFSNGNILDFVEYLAKGIVQL